MPKQLIARGWTGPTRVYEEWRGLFRVESITKVRAGVKGWQAWSIVLRPMDKRGRTNGRTKNLVTLDVGGPRGSVNLTGLVVGRKVQFTYSGGPAPTTLATCRPG